MPRYRVRPTAELAHDGQVLPGGAVVELPRRVAAELPHLVDEIDTTGDVLASPMPAWRVALEDTRAHEHAFVLEQQRAVAQGRADEAALALEQADRTRSRCADDLSARRATVAAIETELTALATAPAETPESPDVPASATSAPSAPAPRRAASAKKE